MLFGKAQLACHTHHTGDQFDRASPARIPADAREHEDEEPEDE